MRSKKIAALTLLLTASVFLMGFAGAFFWIPDNPKKAHAAQAEIDRFHRENPVAASEEIDRFYRNLETGTPERQHRSLMRVIVDSLGYRPWLVALACLVVAVFSRAKAGEFLLSGFITSGTVFLLAGVAPSLWGLAVTVGSAFAAFMLSRHEPQQHRSG